MNVNKTSANPNSLNSQCCCFILFFEIIFKLLLEFFPGSFRDGKIFSRRFGKVCLIYSRQLHFFFILKINCKILSGYISLTDAGDLLYGVPRWNKKISPFCYILCNKTKIIHSLGKMRTVRGMVSHHCHPLLFAASDNPKIMIVPSVFFTRKSPSGVSGGHRERSHVWKIHLKVLKRGKTQTFCPGKMSRGNRVASTGGWRRYRYLFTHRTSKVCGTGYFSNCFKPDGAVEKKAAPSRPAHTRNKLYINASAITDKDNPSKSKTNWKIHNANDCINIQCTHIFQEYEKTAKSECNHFPACLRT